MLMSGGSSNTVFQVDEQRRLVELWTQAAATGRLPSREDMSPKKLVSIIPHISFIDVIDKRPARIRMAGTELRNLYGREITGLSMDQMPFGPAQAFWRDTFEIAVRTRTPAWGAAPATGRHDPQAATQMWARLPLAKDGVNIDLVMAVDCIRWTSSLPAKLRNSIQEAFEPVSAYG
jgi:hypothetical protein